MFDKNSILKPESKVIEHKTWRGETKYVCETTFTSINHLMRYIENTPLNENNRWGELSSSRRDYSGWYMTSNFEEALELLKNGYEAGTEELRVKLQCETNQDMQFVRKMCMDVVGFQPCVPNYLMGIPQNMFNQKLVAKKQKIITLNKCVDYAGRVSAKEILEYSVRTLRIIQELEKQGFAVNLNIVDGYSSGSENEIIKVRIKNSNERLNLAKLAFPLLHPSMLRRIMFRYVEVSDTTPYRTQSKGAGSIGSCVGDYIYETVLKEEHEVFLKRDLSERDMQDTIKLQS